ncbi:thioredoxin family protein [Photobacterium sp. J15]|uniref:thioredoxin family protein n=1 Tax=Photobacterium sp. J15 TaxID=265901 RepID=UPI0007E39DCA|nr:thioredoxin family protein [Photobacterium sp. J15]
MSHIKTLLLFLILVSSQALAKQNNIYDPTRIAIDDYYNALATATVKHQNIFVIAGGNWCKWCYKFEKDLHKLGYDKTIKSKFVFMKANWSEENENEGFFNLFPKIKAFPHIMIISNHGKLLESRPVNFSEKEFVAILNKYSDAT